MYIKSEGVDLFSILEIEGLGLVEGGRNTSAEWLGYFVEMQLKPLLAKDRLIDDPAGPILR